MPGMRYQPQGLARVAGNWIAGGMMFSVQAGTGLRDLVRGLPMLGRGANQAVRAFPGGLAFDCRGVATAGYINVAGEAAQLASDQSAIFYLIIAGAPSGSVPAIGGIWRSASQDDGLLVIERSSADAIQMRFRIGGASAIRTFSTGVSSLYGRRLTIAASIARGAGRSVFLRIAADGQILFDQEQTYSTSGASSDITPTGTEYLSIGSEQIENPTRNPNCIIYAQHHLARVVSADEVANLSRMPWQAYQAPEADDDGAAAIERRLSVSAAALGLAGGHVGIRVSRRLRAAPAELAVSSGPVTVRAARRLRVQPAALAVAGQGVALRVSRRLRVAPAVLGLAGGQVGMQYAAAPAPGSYTQPVSAAAMQFAGGSVGMRVTRRLQVVGAQLGLVGGNVLFQVGRRPGAIDVSAISPSRIVAFESSGSRLVIFEGSGSRVVVFGGSGKRVRFNQMSAKVPIKVGEKWTVDRDRDEISYHAADITDELADRNTTADESSVVALLFGVVLLEGPQVQVATIDGVERTFVVVKLGGVDGDPPDDWRWVARVPCVNGERFDKTTWFNEVDP